MGNESYDYSAEELRAEYEYINHQAGIWAEVRSLGTEIGAIVPTVEWRGEPIEPPFLARILSASTELVAFLERRGSEMADAQTNIARRLRDCVEHLHHSEDVSARILEATGGGGVSLPGILHERPRQVAAAHTDYGIRGSDLRLPLAEALNQVNRTAEDDVNDNAADTLSARIRENIDTRLEEFEAEWRQLTAQWGSPEVQRWLGELPEGTRRIVLDLVGILRAIVEWITGERRKLTAADFDYPDIAARDAERYGSIRSLLEHMIFLAKSGDPKRYGLDDPWLGQPYPWGSRDGTSAGDHYRAGIPPQINAATLVAALADRAFNLNWILRNTFASYLQALEQMLAQLVNLLINLTRAIMNAVTAGLTLDESRRGPAPSGRRSGGAGGRLGLSLQGLVIGLAADFVQAVTSVYPSMVGYDVALGNHLAAQRLLVDHLVGLLQREEIVVTFREGWPDPTRHISYPRVIGPTSADPTGRIVSVSAAILGNDPEVLDHVPLDELVRWRDELSGAGRLARATPEALAAVQREIDDRLAGD